MPGELQSDQGNELGAAMCVDSVQGPGSAVVREMVDIGTEAAHFDRGSTSDLLTGDEVETRIMTVVRLCSSMFKDYVQYIEARIYNFAFILYRTKFTLNI